MQGELVALLTFAPPEAAFLAHPIGVMRAQAQALGLEHVVAEVAPPFEASYRQAIIDFAERYAVTALISGDIDMVEGRANWVRQCCAGTGVELLTPLWGRERRELLDRVIALGFEAIFTCLKAPPFDAGWPGRRLDRTAVEELVSLGTTAGIDLSGEQGEYHTVVLAGPDLAGRVRLRSSGVRYREDLVYLKIEAAGLEPARQR